HTRLSRDWSSDVCSSDLPLAHHGEARAAHHHGAGARDAVVGTLEKPEVPPASGPRSLRQSLIFSRSPTPSYWCLVHGTRHTAHRPEERRVGKARRSRRRR